MLGGARSRPRPEPFTSNFGGVTRLEPRDGRVIDSARGRALGGTAQRGRFLPPGPLREAAERRLWVTGHEIGDLNRTRRPAPRAASWVSDSQA
jgi:hypothetical protein